MIARAGVFLTLVVAVIAGAATTAHAATGPDFFGANIQPMVKLGVVAPQRWPDFLDAMSHDGLTTARADAVWADAEPNPPVGGVHRYDWTTMDQLMTALWQSGVQLSAVLSTPPAWAGATGTRLAPTHYADYAAFAGAVAARYGSQGAFWAGKANPVPLRDYEVWTEPNSANFWSGRPDPAAYLSAFIAVSDAVHAADPAGKVLVSLGWQSFASYARALYAGGLKGHADGIGFHPYSPIATGIFDLVRQLRAVTRENGDATIPIYVTELGQPVVTSGLGAPSAGEGVVTDAARAATQSLAAEALARSDCGVEDYLIYANVASELPDQPGESYEAFMGVYRKADATPNLTGAALRDAATRWMARPVGGIGLCGASTQPGALLPLQLTMQAGACPTAIVTYRGNPLEGALPMTGGAAAGPPTNAYGVSPICLPPCTTVQAIVPDVAMSNPASLQPGGCGASGGGGSSPGASSPGGPAPAPLPVPPAAPAPSSAPSKASCTYRLQARIARIGRRSTRLRVGLTCAGRRPARAQVALTLERRGQRARPAARTQTLVVGRPATIVLDRRLRRGDRIRLVVASRAGIGLDRQEVTVRVPVEGRSAVRMRG